jgi:hypothetical protein
MTLDGERLVEIKCRFKGPRLDLCGGVERGAYLSTTRGRSSTSSWSRRQPVADVFVFDGGEGVGLPCCPRPQHVAAESTRPWNAFMRSVTKERTTAHRLGHPTT